MTAPSEACRKVPAPPGMRPCVPSFLRSTAGRGGVGAGRRVCPVATGGGLHLASLHPAPVMRRLLLALVFAAPAALAQPTFTAEASVDQKTYAYGEVITARFVVRNESGETATLWGSDGAPRTSTSERS